MNLLRKIQDRYFGEGETEDGRLPSLGVAKKVDLFLYPT